MKDIIIEVQFCDSDYGLNNYFLLDRYLLAVAKGTAPFT
jgi:hypothetical protein